MTSNRFFQRDIVSISQFDSDDIRIILDMAENCKNEGPSFTLREKIIANCFFEPSTRTRLSFEAASYRAGANVIGFQSEESLSVRKGETLQDTIQVISQYADLIVLRHSKEGAAMLAAEVSDIPVINAGDGANQHPTQALTDLFTIRETQGRLNDLAIALVGDLKYGRTIHSLVEVCSLYDIRLYLVSEESLALPETLCNKLKKRGVRFSFHKAIDDVIKNVDVLYLTRLQRERFEEGFAMPEPVERMLHPALLKHARPHLKVLHPLPRVNELPREIDSTPFAAYFQQAKNGLFVRQALLNLILRESVT